MQIEEEAKVENSKLYTTFGQLLVELFMRIAGKYIDQGRNGPGVQHPIWVKLLRVQRGKDLAM